MCLSVGLLAKLSFRRQDDKKEEKLDELKKKGKKKEVKQATERMKYINCGTIDFCYTLVMRKCHQMCQQTAENNHTAWNEYIYLKLLWRYKTCSVQSVGQMKSRHDSCSPFLYECCSVLFCLFGFFFNCKSVVV